MLGHDLLRKNLTYRITHGQLLRYRLSSQRHDDEPKEGFLKTKIRRTHLGRDVDKGEEWEEGVTKRAELFSAVASAIL
jgi:hypothetical protein